MHDARGLHFSGAPARTATEHGRASRSGRRRWRADNVLTVDYGFQANVQRTLSGTLWNDADRDGAIDAGETGFAGVTVDVLLGRRSWPP